MSSRKSFGESLYIVLTHLPRLNEVPCVLHVYYRVTRPKCIFAHVMDR
jgi:hypothetical protein